jgi:hypothetical protein
MKTIKRSRLLKNDADFWLVFGTRDSCAKN